MKFDPKKQFVSMKLDSRYLRFHGIAQILLGLLLLLVNLNGFLPVLVVTSAAAGMVAIGVYNYTRHVEVVSRIAGLSVPNYSTVTMEWIAENRTDEDTFYLGKGYDWGTECTQIYHQFSNLPNLKDIVDIEPKGGGKVFLHNIGKEKETHKFMHLPEHTIVAGATGVGKTRTLELLICQMITNNNSAVIIIDPKGDKDLLNSTYSLAQKNCRENSFQFFSLLHPNKSGTWDLFGDCTKGSEVADRITSIITEGGGGAETTDPFIGFCWSLVEATAHLMIVVQEKVTPKKLYEYLVINPEPLLVKGKQRLERCTPGNEQQTLEEALNRFNIRVVEHPLEHKDKMTALLNPTLTILGTDEIGGLLSPEVADMSIADIINNRRIVYIYLGAMATGRVSATVGKLIVQNIVGHIGRDYASKHILKPFHLIVDEFYSVAFPGYIEMLAKARAAGLRMYLGMQTSSDIASALGDIGVQQIITNTSNYICHRIPEKFFSEIISETFGTTTVPSKTVTRGISAGMDKADNLFRSSTAERLEMTETPRVSPEMLTSLPRGEVFLISQGYHPIKLAIARVENDIEPGKSYFDMLNPEKPMDFGELEKSLNFGQEEEIVGNFV